MKNGIENKPNGYYWGLVKTADGTLPGIICVTGNKGEIHGCSFSLDKIDLGDDPEPMHPPRWLLAKIKTNL